MRGRAGTTRSAAAAKVSTLNQVSRLKSRLTTDMRIVETRALQLEPCVLRLALEPQHGSFEIDPHPVLAQELVADDTA